MKQRKTHCIHGHAYTAENTYWHAANNSRQQYRYCRTCQRLRYLTPPPIARFADGSVKTFSGYAGEWLIKYVSRVTGFDDWGIPVVYTCPAKTLKEARRLAHGWLAYTHQPHIEIVELRAPETKRGMYRSVPVELRA